MGRRCSSPPHVRYARQLPPWQLASSLVVRNVVASVRKTCPPHTRPSPLTSQGGGRTRVVGPSTTRRPLGAPGGSESTTGSRTFGQVPSHDAGSHWQQRLRDGEEECACSLSLRNQGGSTPPLNQLMCTARRIGPLGQHHEIPSIDFAPPPSPLLIPLTRRASPYARTPWPIPPALQAAWKTLGSRAEPVQPEVPELRLPASPQQAAEPSFERA